MKELTISEQMQYNTVRIVSSNGGTGTGFFFDFNINNNIYPIIITNKHVINNNEKESIKFLLHTKKGNEVDEEKINITFNTNRYFHEYQDLCFCLAAPLFHHIKNVQNKEVFYISINEKLIQDDSKLKNLSAIEDIVMVGYPNGLWNEKHNFPLFRKGITSSHPAVDFNNKNIGVVDMACFPGSSGSPIFIFNENGYGDKTGFHLGAHRLLFLGILFAGPQCNTKGELIIENIPTQQKLSSITPTMLNLGYYIKAKEILTFKEIILKNTQNQ